MHATLRCAGERNQCRFNEGCLHVCDPQWVDRWETPVSGAVVFQLHYNELLAKDEEITKLRAVIQGLSGR